MKSDLRNQLACAALTGLMASGKYLTEESYELDSWVEPTATDDFEMAEALDYPRNKSGKLKKFFKPAYVVAWEIADEMLAHQNTEERLKAAVAKHSVDNSANTVGLNGSTALKPPAK